VKIAVLGNCQVDPLRHMLLFANPNLEIIPFNVNNLRREEDQKEVFQRLTNFELIVSQVLTQDFKTISSESIKSQFPNTLIIPNLFFLGWHPEMTYLGDGKNRVIGPSEDLHDLVCVLIAQQILDNSLVLEADKVEHIYDHTFREFMKLHDSFEKSRDILRNRFQISDLSFEDFEEMVGFDQPFMFTHNHPMNRAFLGIAKQILGKLQVSSRFEDQELIDYTPNPLANRVAWSPIYPSKEYSSLDFRERIYYVGKGRFVNNSIFIREEIAALTKLKQIPSIRRPDISGEILQKLSKFVVKLGD
jgi:hypothetical protein